MTELVDRGADVGPHRLLPEARPVTREIRLEQSLDGRSHPVHDGAQTGTVGLPRAGHRLERRVDGATARVSEHHHQLDSETLDCELHAPDARGGDDIPRDADDEQVSQPLIEDDLGRDARIREVGKNVIIPSMRAVEAEDATRCLAGFEHRFKGEDRLKEKVVDQLQPPSELTAAQALNMVADALRFTFTYQETGYTTGVHNDVELMKEQGFELIKLKNTWTSDQYKGINSQWQEPESAVRFEVQFHTQASLEAKELSHKAYERLRGTEAQDDEREELEAFQSRVNSKVPIPPDVSTIEDYPPEKRDG